MLDFIQQILSKAAGHLIGHIMNNKQQYFQLHSDSFNAYLCDTCLKCGCDVVLNNNRWSCIDSFRI